MTLLAGSLTHAAVIALLEASVTETPTGGAPVTVYPDGAPDLAQPPYVTAWLTTDLEDPDRLEGSSNRRWWRVTTHSVGRSPGSAVKVADLVGAALLDARPSVDGAPATRIRHNNGRPPVTDESTGVSVSDVVDQWTFQSWPARPVPPEEDP
jgi:hypothetical protein